MKRIIALVLSLVMALSLCAPAWGAGESAIEVDTAAELIAAVEDIADGGTITLTNNVTFTEGACTKNSDWYEGLYYIGDKSFTIDLNKNTITNDEAVNDYLMLFKNDGAKANTITFTNGTIEAASSAYCAICTSTGSTQQITINLENVNLTGNNSNGSVAKIRGGAVLNVKAGTVITGKDSYLGIENANATVNIYDGAEIYQNGTTSYNGCLVGTGSNGTVNVYGGYGESAKGAFIAMTSGGTINVSGGEWIANTDGTPKNDNYGVLIAQNDKTTYADAGNSVINVTGGAFKGGYNCYGNAVGDAQINISAGAFSADPSTYVDTDVSTITESNDTYTVTKLPAVAKVGDKEYSSLQAAIDDAVDGAEIDIIANFALTAQDANPLMNVVYNRESYCGIYIPDDKAITLDLNGHTVSYVDTYGDCDNLMILNLGNLTINDSVGGGKLTYKPVAGTKTYTYFYSTIFNCGTLTINGGTIENTCETATDVTNAVDNHSRLSHEYDNDCILTVNGGTLIGAEYRAIRQYTHYFEGVQNRVTINDGTIKGGIYMQHGESWYYTDPAVKRLNVDCYLTINGGTIDTLDDGYGHIRMYLSNPDNNAFGLEINDGNINVPVQIQVQKGYRYSEDGKATSGTLIKGEATGARNTEWLAANGGFISGGYFTTNVSDYCVEGKVVVTSDKEGYPYTVGVKAADTAEVEVAEPVIDVDTTGMTEQEKTAATEVANELKTSNVVEICDDALTAVATEVANETSSEAKNAHVEELNDVLVNDVTAAEVEIAVQTYFDIKVADVEVTNTTVTEVTLNITPMYQLVATTTDVLSDPNTKIDTDTTDGDGANAVKIGNPVVMKIDKPVEITVDLPAAFADKEVYVKHQAEKGVAIYKATADANGKLTFTNKIGFSPFTFSTTQINAGASVTGGDDYADLQSALNYAGKNAEITVKVKNQSAVVSGEFSFTLKYEGEAKKENTTITAAPGYSVSENNGVYTVTKVTTGGYYPYYPSTTPNSELVKSPDTFDAGIALYVGVSVMGAIGTVVLGKKRED